MEQIRNLLITGSSSGIGKAICQTLEDDYNIITLKTRLQDTKQLQAEIKNILKNQDIDILINCAGVGIFEPHEQLNLTQIEQTIAINLTAPIIITNLVLRSLKKTKGHIINISSIEATRHSKFSALYTATKSGLRDFGLSLFEELRKSEVKVTNINPDITKTNFFDNLNFEPTNIQNTYIQPNEIAKLVQDILRFDAVVTDITIRPQKFAINKKQKGNK
jgi:short-subunit dehydrogenase